MRRAASRENLLLPREKRLLLVVLALALLVKFTPSVLKNNQSQNLAAIRSHISKTELQWKDFQVQHGGYEKVHLFDYTGGDGMFGAYGEVPSAEHIATLRKFMEDTLPPRPIYLGLVSAPRPEFMDPKKGKNSQGLGLATNSGSSLTVETKTKPSRSVTRR